MFSKSMHVKYFHNQHDAAKCTAHFFQQLALYFSAVFGLCTIPLEGARQEESNGTRLVNEEPLVVDIPH